MKKLFVSIILLSAIFNGPAQAGKNSPTQTGKDETVVFQKLVRNISNIKNKLPKDFNLLTYLQTTDLQALDEQDDIFNCHNKNDSTHFIGTLNKGQSPISPLSENNNVNDLLNSIASLDPKEEEDGSDTESFIKFRQSATNKDVDE